MIVDLFMIVDKIKEIQAKKLFKARNKAKNKAKK